MTTALSSTFLGLFDPVRLIGPIFDKELRVSSRRRRNYLLRFGYVVLLSLFILSVWYSVVGIRGSGSAVYRMSRLSRAGKEIISAIVWFQFVVAQLVAIVMLSSSIGDEINSGTLAVLMTTPVSSFQIVAGKLLSKLLQLMLLLAISLPLLAILRVFGGVPWDYVVSSVCITLTAALLAGALSLLLSITCRHAHIVILAAIVGYLALFGAFSGLVNMLAFKKMFIFDQDVTQSILALTNPFWAMAASTQAMFVPGSQVPGFSWWPAHCLIMLGVAAVLLVISVWRVRRAALCEAFGRPGKPRARRASRRKYSGSIDDVESHASTRTIKRLTGSPIVWKEMRKGFMGHGKANVAISVLLATAFVVAAVLLLLSGRNNIILPYYCMSGLYLVAMIRLAVFSAGSIAGEKQARTWPILLVTPLEDREIIRGKAIAAIWRNGPLLLLYWALFCIFYIRVDPHPFPHIFVGLLITAAGLAGSVMFVIGSGSYFGVRLRSVTVAVVATVGSYLVIAYLFCGMFNPLRILLSMLAVRVPSSNPAVIFGIYYAVSIVTVLTQAGIGVLLAQRAVRRLRRNIF